MQTKVNAPLNTVLQEDYAKLDYLLEELDKPTWAWLPSASKLVSLRSYRVEHRQRRLQLGLEPKNTEFYQTGRRHYFLAVRQILDDLATLPPADQPAYEPLYQFMLTEQALIRTEYAFYGVPTPTQTELDATEERAVLEACLSHLHRAKPLLPDARWHAFKAPYRESLAALGLGDRGWGLGQNETPLAITVVKPPEIVKPVEKIPPKPETVSSTAAHPVPDVPNRLPPIGGQSKIVNRKSFDWSALLSDTILRTLMYIGALFVVLGAVLYTTLNWKQFDPFWQVTMLLAADGAFLAASFFTIKKLQLARAGVTFLAISAALFPLVLFGYTRPELLNFDTRGTWAWISVLTLPCYIGLAAFVRDRIFSYMSAVAIFSAYWSLLYQAGVPLEWLLPAGVPVGKLANSPKWEELSSGAFWVGQAVVVGSAVGIFSCLMGDKLANRLIDPSLEWATGVMFWFATLFYAWNAARTSKERLAYRYGVAVMGAVAFYLALQKLPIETDWQPVALALLGVGYLLWQNLSDLVHHLNFDGNARRWHVSEVFAVRKPFSNLGWLFVVVGMLLSTQQHLAFCAALVVLSLTAGAGALLYRWNVLAWASVATLTLAIYLLPYQSSFGIIASFMYLIVVVSGHFGIWLVTRHRPLFAAFRLPLQLAGHGWLIFWWVSLIVVVSPSTYLEYRAIVLLFYIALAAAYRNRLTVHVSLALSAYWVTAFWLSYINPNKGIYFFNSDLYRRWQEQEQYTPLILLTVGVIFAVIGVVLGYKRAQQKSLRRDVYALPFQQWGFGIASVGMVWSLLNYTKSAGVPFFADTPAGFTFITSAALYTGLATLAAYLAYHDRLYFWQIIRDWWAAGLPNKSETVQYLFRHGANSLWLTAAVILLPFWLHEVVGRELSNGGSAALALFYFGLGVALAKFGKIGRLPFGVYSFAPLATWLFLGLTSLWRYNGVSFTWSIIIALILTFTSAFGARLWHLSLFHWLIVNLLPWVSWNFYKLSGLELYWLPFFVGATAILLLIIGETMQGKAGRAYSWTAHQQAAGSGVVALLLYASTFVLDNRVVIGASLSAFLMLSVPYAALVLLRRHPVYVYPLGLIISLGVIMWGKLAYMTFGWSLGDTLICSFLLLAVAGGILHKSALGWFRYSWPVTKRNQFPPQYVLSYMCHFWAGLALLFAAQSTGWRVALVCVAVGALYAGRSLYERRDFWAYVAVASWIWAYFVGYHQTFSSSYFGLALFVPALALYVVSFILPAKIGRNFQWLALFGLVGGLYFSMTDTKILLLHALALTLLGFVGALRTGHTLWLTGALAAGHLSGFAAWLWLASTPAYLPVYGVAGLLTVGMVLLAAAVIRGQVTLNLNGYGRWLDNATLGAPLRPKTQTDITPPAPPTLTWREVSALPLYIFAFSDLSLSLVLALSGNFWLKLVTGVIVLVALFVANLREQNRVLSLATVALAVAGTLYLGSRTDTHTSVIIGAAGAAGLLAAGYLLNRGTTALTAPFARFGGHLLMLLTTVRFLTLYHTSTRQSTETLSWLLLILGVAYLFVSRKELTIYDLRLPIDRNSTFGDLLPADALQATNKANHQSSIINPVSSTNRQSFWRCVSYGALAAIEGWFGLRLALGNVGQWQMYVIPVGLLLLYFGWQERRSNNGRIAPLLEALGLIILLGTTLLQASGLQTDGVPKTLYGGWLIIESLLVLAFGAHWRLRYYFLGSLAGLLGAGFALAADPVAATDKWLVLGLSGLALVCFALFLERKRESVRAFSRDWFYRLKQWG
jgi:hypothetical protein